MKINHDKERYTPNIASNEYINENRLGDSPSYLEKISVNIFDKDSKVQA